MKTLVYENLKYSSFLECYPWSISCIFSRDVNQTSIRVLDYIYRSQWSTKIFLIVNCSINWLVSSSKIDIPYTKCYIKIQSIFKKSLLYFGRFATAEEEVTCESSGPQVKPHQWVEARNTNGKLHKLKSVLLVSGYRN